MYITITGLGYYMGIESIKPGDKLYLIKDTNNTYDDEAIKVIGNNEVTYGYVANSVNTVARGTHSAGYIYDLIKDKENLEICFITDKEAIAKIMLE